jgi:hypothetical protein
MSSAGTSSASISSKRSGSSAASSASPTRTPTSQATPTGPPPPSAMPKPAIVFLLAQSAAAGAKLTSAVAAVPARRPGALVYRQ